MKDTRILVVEDEVIVALDIQNRLKRMGYNIIGIVSTGEDAIKKARDTMPDLVLMDIKLKGDLDGVMAAEKIRELFSIPVVYLTAFSDEDTLERAKVTEPFGYMVKPLEERELYITIEMALYKHRMDKKIKENERWLSTTLNSIAEGLIATDRNAKILFTNPVCDTLTGWTKNESLGKDLSAIFKIIDGETRKPMPDPVSQALQEGVIIDAGTYTLLVTKFENEIPVDYSASLIRDERNNVTGTVIVFRDITERLIAQDAVTEAEEFNRAVLNSLPSSIAVIDAKGFL